jgi:Fuc2NAc and GlcNAc transferase
VVSFYNFIAMINYQYILVCTVLFLSIGFLFLYKKIAIHYNILANPNYRTLHESPTPKGGGLIFSLLFVFSVLILWGFNELSNQLFYVLGFGGLIATLFGFIDDIKNTRAKTKLIIQLFLGIWTIYWLNFSELLLLDWMPDFVIIPFILFFMVWTMNAYNFMDGIDGMAASGAIFISSTLASVLLLTGGSVEFIGIFILIAFTVSGFMVFNWPPATIFMGDSGSVFLGYIFGSLLLFTVFNNDISVWSWLTVSGYFFSDTTVTQIMRVILVRKWYLPHRSHAYQNLARITNSHLKITGGVTMYNLIWVLPLTLWSSLQPEMGFIAATLSITPALVVVYKYGPLFSSS